MHNYFTHDFTAVVLHQSLCVAWIATAGNSFTVPLKKYVHAMESSSTSFNKEEAVAMSEKAEPV
jgi:hypothetical protein